VDICWRIQHEGLLITFAPGAFVWHHRRRNPRSYLRQQAGYGEAEALLHSKHPDRFNGRGDGKWRGVMYGGSLQGLQLHLPIIYRGTFGTGMFQCLYQPGVAHWAMLPSTLEWQVAALLLGLAGVLAGPPGWILGVAMWGLSLLVAALQAVQARLVPARRRWCARLLIAALCYAQPLVRSWTRYRTRLSSQRAPGFDPAPGNAPGEQLPLTGHRSVAYWSEAGLDRTELLRRAMAVLDQHRWGRVLDTGWFEWDLAVHCDSGLILKVVTAQEEHGQGRRLIRIRYQLAPTARLSVIASVSLVALAIVALPYPRAGMAVAALVLALGVRAWMRGLTAGARVVGLFRAQAHQMQMDDCPEEARSPSAPPGSREDPGSADDPGGPVASRPEPDGAGARGAFAPAFPSMVALDGPSPSENTEQFA
jgi:O-antigen biosynthesis protein